MTSFPRKQWGLGEGKATIMRQLSSARCAGVADKAVNLVGCKSPHHQLPEFVAMAEL